MPNPFAIRSSSALAGSLAPFILGMVFGATPGLAQQSAPAPAAGATAATSEPAATAEDTGEIIVTGSRISRPDLEASSPVSVLSGVALKNNNAVTVEQLLQSSPQFVPAQSGSSNNPGQGVATIDLRGLDPKRTLVLVDGKRMVSYDTQGQVDVNTIPTALIKRIETLTGGASSVYGSDAIAGVVNFILDDRFEGYQVDGSSSITGHADGAQYDGSLTAGWKLGDRGNFVVSAAYSQRMKVQQRDRGFSAQTLDSSDLSPTGSANGVPTIFDNTFNNGPTAPDSGLYQLAPNGDIVPQYALYNFNPPNYFQSPLKRYSVTALARYEITDGVEFFGRGTYVKSKVQLNLAPTATAGFTFNISPDNPFLSAQQKAILFADPSVLNDGSGVGADPTARAGTLPLGIRRRVVETGGRQEDFDNQAWQIVGGLRGNFGSNYHWEVSAQYAETKRSNNLLNDLYYPRVVDAIDAVAGPNGTVVCRGGQPGCVPLNVFSTAPLSSASLGYVLANAHQDDKTTQLVASGNLSGDVGFLKSPFADHPAAFAIGAEYRRETGVTRVDDNYASGNLIYYGQGQNIGPNSYDVKEVYGELKIPIIQDRPFFNALNLEGGFRYSDYSTVGAVYTYKGGADWSPVQGLRFRGLYQRAVRAPNIYELYSPVVAGTDSLQTDPCAGPVSASSPLGKLCLATGVPASRLGSVGVPVAGQVNVLTGGNPNLKAESADTYTLGVVVAPLQVRGLTLSVDYYSIKIANAIANFGGSPTNIINGCYNTANNPSLDPTSPFCQAASLRNPLTGQYSGPTQYGIQEQLFNIAVIKTEGIDVGAAYRGDLGPVNYGLSFNGTFVRSYNLKPDPTQPNVQCAGRFGAACNLNPIPKWKHVADLSLGFGAVNLLTRWRYVGPVSEDVGTDILVSRIKAFNYFDETVSINVNDKFTFRVGIQNAFDKQPPIIGDTSGNGFAAGSTFPNTYDVLGRTFFAGVTAKF